MKCPSAAEIARRFAKYAPGRLDRYEEGVRNPDEDWEKNTKDAEPNYEEGVKKAIARKAFGKGVAKCGTSRQQAKTITKGIPNWVPGIEGSEQDMADAMGPVVSVIQATTLPARYPKGDPRSERGRPYIRRFQDGVKIEAKF